MRIEVQVPLDTDPNKFDEIMETAAKKHGYVLMRRSRMPINYTSTIVVDQRDVLEGLERTAYISLAADLYKLKPGEQG